MLVTERRIKVEGVCDGNGRVMNHNEHVFVGTSKTAVQRLINAPWRQVLPNMEI